MVYKALLSLILFIFISHANGQDQHIITAKFHYGSVYVHTPNVKNIEGAKPSGLEIEYSKIPEDSISYTKCNCFPRNGIALSYFNFDKSFLGNGNMLSYFLEPQYRLSNHMNFLLRASVGITYTSNPFNSTNNPDNKNYVSYINPYLQVGSGLNLVLSKHFSFSIMESFQHFSNGGFKEPNRGLNWVTSSVGILYHTKSTTLPKYQPTSLHIWKSRPPFVDAGIFIVPQQGFNSKIQGQRKGIYGTYIQFSKQYGRISAFTVGSEFYIDRINYADKSSGRYNILGIHAGHAFLFGPVSFSQQIGYHILNNTPNADKIYLRFGLNYKISRHLITGVSLKTHADNAEFTDLRLGYRL